MPGPEQLPIPCCHPPCSPVNALVPIPLPGKLRTHSIGTAGGRGLCRLIEVLLLK